MGSTILIAGPTSTVSNAKVKAKLKKINKQLRQLGNLKKQDNMMAAFFLFLCDCSRVCLSADH
jgi:adenine deaminase